jgi:hypothetical protein
LSSLYFIPHHFGKIKRWSLGLDGGALELYQPPATTYWGFFFLVFSHHYVSRDIRDGEKKGRVAPALVPTLSRGLAQTPKRFFCNFFWLVKIYEEEDLPRVPDDECRNIK